MSNPSQCQCARCRIRALMAPAIVTMLGVLFLLSEVRGGPLSFGKTYPFIFITIGAFLLGSAVAPMDGHISPTPAVPPVPPVPPAPPSYSNPSVGQGR